MTIDYNAAKFINMKQRIKNEVNRRKYTGSVASYGTATYDYTITPAKGELVRAEHYNKIAQPLRAINQNGVAPPTTAGAEISSVTTPTELDAKITLYASKPLTTSSSNSGCAASCTGLCTTACSGSCSGGCSGGCSGCSGSCSGGCSGCSGSCSGGCSGCGSGCSGSCSSRCTGACVSSCGGTCNGTCQSSSTGTCQSACSTTCSGLVDYEYYRSDTQLKNVNIEKSIDYTCQFSLAKLEEKEGVQ